MIVRLEVTASEKVAIRSQFEPSSYGVLVSIEHLDIGSPDELVAQANTLFRRAKEAIATAKSEDGVLLEAKPKEVQPSGNGHAPNGQGKEHQASSKQLDLIQSLAKRAGLDDQKLREFAQNAVGGLDNLTKFDASRLINALQHLQVPAHGKAR